jgi:uncharacterized membrane protein YphA (DoxX/SURF4 family)
MKLRSKRVLHDVPRVALGAVFVLTGAAKLTDIPTFADRVADFGLVFDGIVTPVAWAVAVGEVLLGAALACNLRGSLACVLAFLGVFIAVLTYGVLLGLDIDCGCFGGRLKVPLQTQLVIDLVLVIWCGLVYWSRLKCGVQTIDAFPLRRGAAE